MSDKTNNMVRMISEDGGVVVCAMDSTEIVCEMEKIHGTSAVISAALGRLLTGASLMGTWLKNEDDSLTLRVDGGGPAGLLIAVADGEGNVRGTVSHPVVEGIGLHPNGKLNVGAAVGKDGTLTVIRDMNLREPYIGRTPLVSGEIAEDITAYYAASEQTPTVCALGVLVNKDLSIRKAGGFILQLLPGATEDEIARLEKNIDAMPSVTDFLEQGGTETGLAQLALEGFSPQVLEESRAEYRCHCSEERTKNVLLGLGAEELARMQREENTARVECHFCGKTYAYELDGLLAEL